MSFSKYSIITKVKTPMKKIIFVLPLLLIFSCGPEAKMHKRTYVVENSTDMSVEIYFYERFESRLKQNIVLGPDQEMAGVELEFDQPFINDPNEFWPNLSLYSSDSVVIIFNNERKKTDVLFKSAEGISFSEPIERNVFRHGNYEDISGENFLFSITKQDFESATPCNADCE